ncbi:hypothetical protein ACHAXT_012118 [Thalassiosira profunda]
MARYELGRFLGKGSFACVHLAHDARTQQHCAIKLVDITACQKREVQGGAAGEPSILDILQQEVGVHSSVSSSRHPNVVALLESFRYTDPTTGSDMMAMALEHCSRGDLQGYMKRVKDGRRQQRMASLLPEGKFLSTNEIRHVVSQLLCGLSFLHSRGIVHRDIKASNVLLCPAHGENETTLKKGEQPDFSLSECEIKLGDFGLAVQMNPEDDWAEAQRTFCGTPSCLAPEVVLPSARVVLALLLLLSVALPALRPGGGVAIAAASGDDDELDSGDFDSSDFDDEEGDFDEEYYDEEGEFGYDVEEYESKIEAAMEHHAASSHKLLERSLKEGGAAASVEIGADGSVMVESDNLEKNLWQAEFALAALEREMEVIDKLKMKVGYDSGDEDDDEIAPEDFPHLGEGFEEKPPESLKELLEQEDESLKAVLYAIDDENFRMDTYADIREEADIKASLDPELWYAYTYWELHAYFGCNRAMAMSRPAWDWAKWTEIRQFYHEFVEEDKREFPIPEGEPERTFQFSPDSFDPPLDPFQTKEKGRGLKAARDIPKGEMVFKATNNTLIFTHGHTWRKFLFAINERNGEPFDDLTTCDVHVWSWVQPIEEGGDFVIVTDLDNGSLLNEGRDEPGWEPPNVQCGQDGDTMCMMEYYATKDIKKGEELLCDYREFAYLDAWGEVGV